MRTGRFLILSAIYLLILSGTDALAQKLPDFFDESDRKALEAASYRPAEPDSLAHKVKKGTVSADYNRAGLTILYLKAKDSRFPDNFTTALDSVSIPFKYDDNRVPIWRLEVGLPDSTLAKTKGLSAPGGFFTSIFSKKKPDFYYNDPVGEAVAQAISSTQIPQSIYGHWFQLDRSTNTMGTKVLQERSAYNATDADVAMAEAMQRGLNHVLDQGEKLVNSSYILLMHYHSIMDEQQYAAAKRAKGIEPHGGNDRGKGVVGVASGLLFRVNFNDSVKNAFYQELWPQEGDPDIVRQLRVQAFDKAKFPIEFVGKVSQGIESWEMTTMQAANVRSGGQRITKTRQQLIDAFAIGGLNAVINEFETLFEPFQTKTTVFEKKPILAKIGIKENLHPGQRFFVWEYREKKDGTTFARRKGVVRATNSIFDNRRQGTPCETCPGGFEMAICDTCVSKFYQVAGKRLDKGMLMQQKNDLGIATQLGYAYGGVGGPFLRIDYNTSQLFGKLFKKSLLGFKIYVAGGFDFKQYGQGIITQFGETAGKAPKGQSFFHIYGGLAQDFHFLRNYSAGVEFGFGYEGASWKDSKISLGTLMLLPGFNVSRNILHNMQVVLGGKWVVTEAFSPTGSTEGGADIVFNDGIRWGDVYDGGWFKRRTGPQISLGIRYNY